MTDITDDLTRARAGDASAAERLAPLVYDRLRRLAASYLRGERSDHTLQPTALVHEAYLKLVDQTRVELLDRNHFMSVAAGAMRRILIDHARRSRAKKRSGGQRVTLSGAEDDSTTMEVDLLDLDEAMDRLSDRNARQARVVEMRYFGGLSVDETAELLAVSPRTVKDDWRVARAWLKRELSHGGPVS